MCFDIIGLVPQLIDKLFQLMGSQKTCIRDPKQKRLPRCLHLSKTRMSEWPVFREVREVSQKKTNNFVWAFRWRCVEWRGSKNPADIDCE